MADYWDTKDDWIAWLREAYDTGFTLLGSSRLNTDDAWDQWNYGDKDWAFNLLCGAMYDIQSALSQVLNMEDGYGDEHPFHEFVYKYATFDMDALLNAMLVATYEQLQKFVGISDAYRCAIWDQPFNAEFYAALAQGFRQ